MGNAESGSGVRRALPGQVAIYVIGTFLTVAGIIEVRSDLATVDSTVALLFQVFVDIGLALLIVGLGWYLATRDLTPADRWHAAGWCFSGVLLIWGLYVWSRAPGMLSGGIGSLRDGLVLFGNLGGSVGAIAGINRARARQNRRLAATADRHRETLRFLNHLLRHNVLNGVQAIQGYADLLEDHVEPGGEEYLDGITQQGERVTELVTNVRTLSRTLTGQADPEPTDLSGTIRDEVAAARESFGSARFETDIPDGVTVSANPTLDAVFENLLRNAVEHHDGDAPEVSVTVDTDRADRMAEVRIADDGPGIPDDRKEQYLERGEHSADSVGTGLGLFLVDVLVSEFGGSVHIEDNDPRGTVVVVRLPLVEADDGD